MFVSSVLGGIICNVMLGHSKVRLLQFVGNKPFTLCNMLNGKVKYQEINHVPASHNFILELCACGSYKKSRILIFGDQEADSWGRRKKKTKSVQVKSRPYWKCLLALVSPILSLSCPEYLPLDLQVWTISTVLYPSPVVYNRLPPGGTWVNCVWVCAAGLSEPLPHYSLFCSQS